MRRAVCIVGATAVGKTQVAIHLSKIFKGALLSADSVQVFKGLDIISGKDKDELSGSEIYLIDVVNPTEPFSVSQFEELGYKSLERINASKKLPIIVGGTGLYVKSLVDGIGTSNIQPNIQLREELEKLDVESLQKKLSDLDGKIFNQLNESDKKNKRRLIRKIEIIRSGIKNQESRIRNEQGFEFLQIGLEIPREELRARIDARVENRIKQGAIREAESLFSDYKNITPQVKDANGYKQLFEHFLGKTTLKEAILNWKLSEYKHAKNQMTWFRKDKRVKWFDADRKDLIDIISQEIDKFLRA